MSTPMTPEHEAGWPHHKDFNGVPLPWTEPHSKDFIANLPCMPDCPRCEIDRLRANENLAVAAALERAAQNIKSWQTELAHRDFHLADLEGMAREIRAIDPDAQKLLAAHDKSVRRQEREEFSAEINRLHADVGLVDHAKFRCAVVDLARRALPAAPEEDHE